MTIAIGDIHGCLEPLRRLVDRLPEGEELIFLGDYIDRGPDSAGVIHFLKRLARTRRCRFLRGNHEDLMERALRDDLAVGLWMINGGSATLKSYGEEPAQWRQAADRGAFLEADRDFFDALDLYAEDERTIYVHAGVDVSLPEMELQRPDVLLWVRERFFRQGGAWRGKQIVFGHTPTHLMGRGMGEVFRQPPLFGIDTGCVYGGALTGLDTRTLKEYRAAGHRPGR